MSSVNSTFEVVVWTNQSIPDKELPELLGFPIHAVSDISEIPGHKRFRVNEREFLQNLGTVEGIEVFGPYITFLRQLIKRNLLQVDSLAIIRADSVFGISCDNSASDVGYLRTQSVDWQYKKDHRPIILVTG